MIKIRNRDFLSPSHSASNLGEKRFLEFTKELKNYIQDISEMKRLEENGKTHLKNLLFSIGFQNYKIEASEYIDLAIFEHQKQHEVFIETKLPKSSEMISEENFKKKAFAQILYYTDRFGSSSLKHLIITDYETLFLFKAEDIRKITSSPIFPKYSKKAKTEQIYEDILREIDLSNLKYTSFNFTKFSIEDIELVEENLYSKEDEIFQIKRELTAIYKLLSPENLLQLNFGKDMNSLDEHFYHELLHIFGVEERNDSDGIQKILRKETKDRDLGSILELTFSENGELSFEDAFELNIIWLNRILFLKLLEARLVFMHLDFKPFMNFETIPNFQQLQNLFFEVMAKEIEERKGGLDIFSKIPYMNSSLFEKKEIETKFFGIRDLDSNIEIKFSETSILGNKKMKTLDYLFKFLNSYDFGSNKFDEISPIDKTLIKSSVLGLIFEKVNGYQDGSHYTPSFITQKLARESLDKFSGDLKKIKILDPAVGSGHILVSAMNELVIRQIELKNAFGKKRELKIENDEIFISDEVQYISNSDGVFPDGAITIQVTLFNIVKEIIENNLFGVDINRKSVEISRLRLWIELLKWSYYDENGKFTTLPNIDINIKSGNSLVSKFGIHEKLDKNKTGELLKLVKEYMEIEEKNRKAIIREEISKIENSFSEKLGRNSKDAKDLSKKLDKYIDVYGIIGVEDFYPDFVEKLFFTDEPKRGYKKELKPILELYEKIQFMEKLPNSFEWRYAFPEVLDENGDFVGFDLIIANPPYIRQEKIKDLKPYLEKRFEIFNGTADIYTYFFELGLNLLSKNGVLSYITSNKWTRAKYGLNLRKMILEETKIHRYDDFNGIKMFDNATVDTSIISLSHRKEDENLNFEYCTYEKVVLDDIDGFGNPIKVVTYPSKCFNYKMSDLSEESFSFANSEELKIKHKIEQIGTPLKDWDIKIYRGVLTGLNDAFIVSTEKRNEILNSCTSSEERTKTESIFKKLLRGRDIKRYSYEWADLWLIYIPWDFKIDEFPAIKSHLNQFNDKLTKRPEVKAGRYNWYALSRYASDYFQDFEKEKIVWNPVNGEYFFTFLENPMFFNNSLFMITGKNLKNILAFMNSKVAKWLVVQMTNLVKIGVYAYGSKDKIEKIPIPKPTPKSEKVLTVLVDYILDLKNKNQNVELFENLIDTLVYNLYFENEMKKADCYILDQVYEKIDLKFDDFLDFVKSDNLVQRALRFSSDFVDEVKIINGK
jgi:hypothetical protein